ncbi:hypothetical protein FRC20_004646 [Serendipita sp. 405]|nr:hypothetical protein FRC15_002738 [Serendipita sp. 397]KAG8867857.1 hypothetical protein FRC20_004646 [Serendipita sp. 405]
MMRLGEKADQRSPLAEAQTSEGKAEDVQWFLTVPTGLFTRDMMARWEYGLPPIDIGAAETDLPLDVETACAPSVDIYPSPLSA